MTASKPATSPRLRPADRRRRALRVARRSGQGLVLYFYPKDDTPGCTNEAKDFQAPCPRSRPWG